MRSIDVKGDLFATLTVASCILEKIGNAIKGSRTLDGTLVDDLNDSV